MMAPGVWETPRLRLAHCDRPQDDGESDREEE